MRTARKEGKGGLGGVEEWTKEMGGRGGVLREELVSGKVDQSREEGGTGEKGSKRRLRGV